jgi:hypothetical protein
MLASTIEPELHSPIDHSLAIRRRLQATDNNSSSNNNSVPVTVKVVETVARARWRAGGGTMQPQAPGPLQQLLDDLIELGVVSVLPGFSSSLERLAGLTVDEVGRQCIGNLTLLWLSLGAEPLKPSMVAGLGNGQICLNP